MIFMNENWLLFAEVKLKDARPDIHYQLGVTPNGVELPKCASDPSCQDMINKVK